jgi:hypothetical protein
VGVLCRHVNLNRLRGAIPGDVTKGDFLLIPTVARRGGISPGGRACGCRSAGGIGRTRGGIRSTRVVGSGARRIRSARAGGTRSARACGGCSRGIGRTSRTCGSAGSIRGGICRTRGAGSSRSSACCGIARGTRARSGASSSPRGACAGGARSSGFRRTRGARGGGIIAWPDGVPVIFVGLLCWCANRYRVLVFVAEGDLILALATSLIWSREGHGYHGQYA